MAKKGGVRQIIKFPEKKQRHKTGGTLADAIKQFPKDGSWAEEPDTPQPDDPKGRQADGDG